MNVARLTLSSRFGVADTDMEEPDADDETDDGFDTRRIAIAQIHLLGFIQQMLVEEENPPPSDFDAPWSPGPDSEPE